MRKSILIALMGIAAAATPQTRSSMFVFQNSVWVNLHPFLRGEVYRQGVNMPLGIDPKSLSEADRTAWTSAIEIYTDVAKGDLVFDENARRIANTLAMAGDVAQLPEGSL